MTGTPIRLNAACSGSECTVLLLGQTVPLKLDFTDTNGEGVQFRDRTTRNGVTVARACGQSEGSSFDYWAGWGAHQVFAPLGGNIDVDGTTASMLVPVSTEISSGSNPTIGSATWEGAMLGGRYGADGARP